MQTTAAALTMVRDDAFYLKIWLRYYGEMLGRENCYIINHGRGEEVADLAAGCNVIGIPGDPNPRFEQNRWRLLSNTLAGLLGYYRHVIVSDVDEIVVVDPANGGNLLQWLEKRRRLRVYTPLGLDMFQRLDLECDEITDQVLGPRLHAKIALPYSKPCVLGKEARFARGGHYSTFEKLNAPSELYLLHLKFVDYAEYVKTLDRRNAMVQDIGLEARETTIGRHWYASDRGDDRAPFEEFANYKMEKEFDLDWVRDAMRESWKRRGETSFWQFDRPKYKTQVRLPDRFAGLF
ncbi:Glycosyl transferase family 2 [Thalassococcus halodurans]|uniref:Glycosyl transferase family 2 n=1 Tax=Thalassococcus halodurans TaxID=373675 RepID=A0A1H5VRP9_9RHOB|nr:glycosyltransferase family 2 protein [Thalassococcus halodurans]SEF89910.1 Glycosyl transferase family 2 [Thalassococcus halodurans]